jgi:hypothetical protein
MNLNQKNKRGMVPLTVALSLRQIFIHSQETTASTPCYPFIGPISRHFEYLFKLLRQVTRLILEEVPRTFKVDW